MTIVAFDPEGAKLATAAEDYAVRVFTAAGSPYRGAQHRATVTSISWRNDSVFLATTSGDRTAMLWLPTLGELLQRLDGPGGPFVTGEFNPRGQRLATGGHPTGPYVLDRSGRHAARPLGGSPEPCHGRLL